MIGGEHYPFPSRLSFILNNPLRRCLHSPRRVVEALGVKETDTVLDFGCGPGFYTIPFAKAVRRVIAVDIQPKMLDEVLRYAEKEGVRVECLQSDGQEIPLPDQSCDLIFLSGVYHELGNKESILMELLRLLKLGGRIAIKEKTKKGLVSIGPPIVNLEEVRDKLKTAGFSIIETISLQNDSLIIATNKLKS